MQIACSQASTHLFHCCQSVKQILAVTIIKIDEIRRDPEAFQKAGIVALSVIRAINFHYHTDYFPHFVSVLEVFPSFDFYAFCRLPSYFFYPYNVERIDEYALLNELEVTLCDNWCLGVPDDQGLNRDPLVRNFAREQITVFLKKMAQTQQGFSVEADVKINLYHSIKKKLQNNSNQSFDPNCLDLQDLSVALKPIHWVDGLIFYVFAVADVACVPDFLQGWNLINLAPLANQIGQLDDWIWGTMFVGHSLRFLKVSHALWKGNLKSAELKDLQWLGVASIAECLYCLSILQRRDPKIINYLALIAKSIGLLAFLIASKPSFFSDIDNE